VVDHTTGAPIANASVLLLNEGGQVLKMTIADADGAYSTRVPSPGRYAIRVDAPGYNTHDEPPFAALAGRVVELDFSLVSYVELAPVRVEAESVPFAPGPLQGFYERKERGRGIFITREQIEMRGGNRFTDILRMTPGVEVVALGGTLSTIRIKGTARLGGCAPQLWVDNVHWGTVDLDGDGPDRELIPTGIEAIEVHRPSTVPIEFASFDMSCGAVVVWTKRAP
jgi:hypothetical protein